MSVRIHHLLLILGASATALAAGDAAKDPDAPPAIGFAGMEVHAFKPGISGLRLGDLNGDGRDDIVFINRREARLEILLRRADAPTATDAEMPAREHVFDVRSTVLNQDLESVLLADLDGDGLRDLLGFGRRLGLQRYRMAPDGSPEPPEEVFLEAVDGVRAVDAGDVNGDGRPDIAVFRDKAVDLLWNDGSAALPRRLRLPLAEERTAWGQLVDADGDGALDLLCFLNPPGVPVSVIRGDGKGGFGPEFPVDYTRGTAEHLLRDVDGPGPRIASVLGAGTSLRLSRFQPGQAPALFAHANATAARFCLRGVEKDPPPWLVSDLDGNSYDDLLVAAPELSALHVYAGGPAGLAIPPESIDSLSGISSLARFDDGALLVVSRPEKSAALHAADRLKAFPRLLPLPGEALVCAVAGQIGFVVCRQDGGYRLVQVAANGTTGAGCELAGMLNDPRQALLFTLPDQSHALLLFAEFAEPRMYRIADGIATPVEATAFRALSQTLKREQVGGCLERGTNLIVVCANRTARGYAWKDGRFDVVRQYNPEDKQAALVGACAFGPLDGQDGLLTFDRTGRNLLWFGPNGPPRRLHLDSDPGDVGGLAPLATPHGPRLALIARNAVHVLAPGAPTLEEEVRADYQSDSKEPRLTQTFGARIGRDRPMIAAVDGANNTVELLEKSGENLVHRLTFKVFEVPTFVSERAAAILHEPHDLASGDINGDGICDLALLCQDRLLLYFGE